MIRTLGWWVVLLFAVASQAATPERDLGQGLVYVRVRELPADLPERPAGRAAACVLDLRYVAATAEATELVMAWTNFRSTARAPVIILANTETSAPLRAALATHAKSSGIVVVGVPGADFRPDMAVKSTAEQERRAYDAFAQGMSLTRLTTDNPDKVRNDEASLSKDRLAEATADDALGAKPNAAPIDLTLQRAVHLHRALAALKRI